MSRISGGQPRNTIISKEGCTLAKVIDKTPKDCEGM